MVRPPRKSVWCVFLLALVAGVTLADGQPTGQVPVHLNPVVEKLSQNRHVFGVQTSDLSSWNARNLARAEIDYVYLDMEHNPMRFEAIEHFLYSMSDRAGILKRGRATPVAVFARFAPYAREQAVWVIKQALDIGLMGILFNNVETRKQAMTYVQNMRLAQRKGSKYPNPPGLRGASGGGLAAWFWGVSGAEYVQHADVWPLNPEGDLLALMMIESATGVRNAEAIASVPGVGGFYLGSAGDLTASLGADRNDAPEVEAALQSVMRVCKARNLACGGTVPAEDMPKRITDGYRILNLGQANGGLAAANAAALRAARAALP